MSNETQKPHVYHVSPWRCLWMWFFFGPIIAFFFLAAPRFQLAADRAAMFSMGVLLLVVALFINSLIRSARVEVSAKGICLKKIAFRLEAPWSEIAHLRLDAGHESFVTSQAIGGKGAAKLAAAAKDPGQLFLSYDAGQLALLGEHRLIPIEAFAWQLHHGTLRARIERLAPHLQSDLAVLDAPRPAPSLRETLRNLRQPHPSRWKKPQGLLGILLLLLAIPAGFWIAMSSGRTRILFLGSISVIYQGLFAYGMGGAARGFFQRGHWWPGTGLGLFSLLLAFWAFSTAFSIADRFGTGGLFINAFVLAFFGTLAWGTGYAARAAFRRRSWVIGAFLLLCSIFLGFCAIAAGFDTVSKGASLNHPA